MSQQGMAPPSITAVSGSANSARMSSSSSSSFDMMGLLTGWGGVLIALLVMIVVFVVYYQTIGYYIQLGWEKLSWSRERGERIDIEVPGGLSAELSAPAPAPAGSADGAPMGTGLGAVLSNLETDVESALGGSVGGPKQVFNVSRNVYKFSEAEPLCRAFGAELATYDQVKDAYKSGADWCNYGWVKGQLAVYPTQKDTYDKLQKGPKEDRMSCGLPGVNGGYFPNEDQRFGVNCYGPRPAETALDERLQKEEKSDIAFDRQVNDFKAELESIAVTPWSDGQWSG